MVVVAWGAHAASSGQPGKPLADEATSSRCWHAIAYVILFVQGKDRPAERMIRLDVAIAAGEGRTRGIRGAI
jgi:hypothetical protein